MTTKLTLSIEKAVIQRAKEYALKTGRSLSDLVESYFDQLTSTDAVEVNGLSPELRKLFGVANISKNMDHKKEIRKILQSKHK